MRHEGTTQPLHTHLPVVGIWERRLPGQHLPAHDALHASSRCALGGPRSVWRGVTASKVPAGWRPWPTLARCKTEAHQCSPCTRRRRHRGHRGAAMHKAPYHTPTHKAIHIAVHRGMLAPQHLGRQPAARGQPSHMGNTQHSSAMKRVQAGHPWPALQDVLCSTAHGMRTRIATRLSRSPRVGRLHAAQHAAAVIQQQLAQIEVCHLGNSKSRHQRVAGVGMNG